MTDDPSQGLAWCLDHMGEDGFSLDDCPRRFPEEEPGIQELVMLAGELRGLDIDPSTRFVRALRTRLDQEVSASSPRGETFLQRFRISLANPLGSIPLKGGTMMSWLVIPFLILSLFGGGAIVASAADGAAPGMPLYALDTGFEGLRLGLTRDEGERARLAMAWAEERLAEAEQILESGAEEGRLNQAVDGYMSQLQAAVQLMERFQLHAPQSSAQQVREQFQAQLRSQEQRLLKIEGGAQPGQLEKLGEAARSLLRARDQLHITEAEFAPGPVMERNGERIMAHGGGQVVGPIERTGSPSAVNEWREALSRAQIRTQEMLRLIELGDAQGLEERLQLHLQEMQALRLQVGRWALEDPEVAGEMAAELDDALVSDLAAVNDLLSAAPEWARMLLQRTQQTCRSYRLALQQMLGNQDSQPGEGDASERGSEAPGGSQGEIGGGQGRGDGGDGEGQGSGSEGSGSGGNQGPGGPH
jgi:hypothetical protein